MGVNKMNIIKNRFLYLALSFIVIAIGVSFMVYNNSQGKGFFNYDIQFTGGTSFEVNIGKDFKNDDITNIIKETLKIDNASVQKIGKDTSVNVKMRSLTPEESSTFKDAIIKKYGISEKDISSRNISATISTEMRNKSIIAVAVSCIFMLIYVSLRFKDIRIGASSILSLLHDSLVVLAFYAIFRIPLNEAFIAAILTIIGYSINATIVIFDRLREIKRKSGGTKTNEELVNISVNESLRRSIFTSLTTFFTVMGLYIFGVESVKIFALPIAIGIICGTYSSVFLSGSIWYILSSKKVAIAGEHRKYKNKTNNENSEHKDNINKITKGKKRLEKENRRREREN